MSRIDLPRILAKCTEDGDCLIWTGKVNKKGAPVGTEWIDGKDRYVGIRRRAYEEYHGVKINPRKNVTTCGNPACLAKEHLSLISVSERVRRTHARMDAGTKIRRNKALSAAARANNGKLTPEQVDAIRQSDEGPYIIARKLGVNGVVASRIKRGEGWKDYSAAANPFAGLGA